MNTAQSPLFTPERWRELRALLDRLDALPAADRAQELDRLTANDAELAQAVRKLAGAEDADATLPERAIDFATTMPARIGPFRLLHEIGAGGMGVVYLAERCGSDFTQRVALKLLDGGAGNAARLAARERSILATLAHPNITAFVDAGSENGRAWLAMEYVDGEPLLAWCESHGLDIRERVRLFDQVCAAVVHAHAQLVVHRDLKPSNVLVTKEGAVKLLDFGIALMLDSSRETAQSTRVFTPEYAAPEQLRGERVSTATDVYALGLILYELVCGRRLPTFGHNDEWTTAELASYGTTADAAAGPRTPRSPSARLMRGDLGRVVAHALAPDPTHRYPSAALLREDLQRWLDHRPLGIGRHGIGYVAARFVRRHRAAAAVAAVAIVALIATSGFALWQAHEARLNAARAEHAKTFLAGLFTHANPYSPKQNGTSTADLLRDAAQRIDQEFADAPEMQIELRGIIVDALERLDETKSARELAQHNVDQAKQIYGTRAPQAGEALTELAITVEDTGDMDGARADFNEAYADLREAGEDYARVRISAMTGLAKMANRRDDYAEAQHWHEAVLREREAREGPQSADIVMDLMNLSVNAAYQEHFVRSEEFAQRSHAMLAQVLGADHPRSIYVDGALGMAQIDMGHCDAAVATLRHAVDVAHRSLPHGARMLGTVQLNLGSAEFCAGDDEKAIDELREARSILSAANDPGVGTAELRLGLAELHAHSGEALQTLDAARTHLAATAQRSAGNARSALWALAAYGDALAVMNGDPAGGESLAREARSRLLAGKSADSVKLAEIDRLLADVLDREAAAAEARSLREEALAVYERIYGDDHSRTRALAQELASAKPR